MAYPKLNFFIDDPERLAHYLCYLAKQIRCGYYQDRRFLVLSRLVEKNAQTIYFPDLPYQCEFWDSFKKYGQLDFVFRFEDGPVKMARDYLKAGEVKHTSCLEKDWHKVENQFFATVKEFIPTFDLELINKINVLVTPFGSVGSFWFIPVGKKYDFELTVRQDFGPAQIAETILTTFLHIESPKMSIANWFNREAIIDFLMTKSTLGKLFNYDYKETTSIDPLELPENLVAESETYLKKLGFPIRSVLTSDFNLQKFTPAEKRILGGLTQNRNRLVTYDQIGNWFWGEDEAALDKFNLYSIAKALEKIRKKIKDAGIYEELIYTVRGEGYVLYD